MCNSFEKFFNEKVSKIRKDLDNNCDPASNNTRSREYCINHQSKKASLSAFYHFTVDDVSKLIMSMPSKSCALDILPMWLLKENIEVIAKPITSIINVSLSTGIFPSKLREAVVSPLLKKPSLEKEVLKNYRPVSNISYVSKIMEKVVCNQIKDHLKTHGLQEPLQSAYRELHSTETALLRVRTDILKAMDDNKAVAVILLDLSAAFDTVDHALLLNRLHHTYGICDTTLTWISSYLQNRSFSVCVGDATSSIHKLHFGIPQGSVVGPLFFVLYTCCLGAIIRKYDIMYHTYVDDVQLYLPFDPKAEKGAERAVEILSLCISEISQWMTDNKLKLNNEKTEFFVASSNYNVNFFSDISIQIGNSIISQSPTIKNLGVIFDQAMSMTSNVKSIITSINFHLRNIYRIRRFITSESCQHLTRSLILSRLDYANSLLYGITSKDRKRLQTLQNRAARIVFRLDRRQPSAPLLRELHWLPLESRIIFKLMLLTFKSII